MAAARLSEQLRCSSRSSGPAPDDVDPATLHEAIRCALRRVAAERGALLVLDDLQWSDAATLELLAGARARPRRDAGARRRCLPLRRAPPRSSAAADAKRAAPNAGAGRDRARPTRRRRDGSAARAGARRGTVAAAREDDPGPFTGLAVLRRGARRARSRRSRRCATAPRGLELVEGSEVSVPETVRDAVLLRCSRPLARGRTAAEVAAVGGERFRLEAGGRAAGEVGSPS